MKKVKDIDRGRVYQRGHEKGERYREREWKRWNLQRERERMKKVKDKDRVM